MLRGPQALARELEYEDGRIVGFVSQSRRARGLGVLVLGGAVERVSSFYRARGSGESIEELGHAAAATKG